MADRELRLRLLLDLAASKASSALKGLGREGGATADKLRAARDALRGLQAEAKGIERFRQASKDLAINGNALKTAQTRVRELAQAMKATDQPTQAMQRNFDRARAEAGRLKDRQQQLTQQQERLRRELVAAGVPLQGMAQHQARLAGRVQQATNAVNHQQQALRRQAEQMRRVQQLEQTYQKRTLTAGAMGATGYAMQAAGRKGVSAALGPVQQFMAHEDAMLGIARQVPGARDEMGRLTKVYRQAEQQVRALSREIPLATTEIADMMTAAARMEVPTEHLASQVKLAAEMAIAFDAVPDEIAESMGKVAKNFKMPVTAIRGLADAINYLDDNAISKGADIIDFLNRTSGVVSTVSMSAQQAAALGSTLLTLGERAETASTATNTIIQTMAAATKGGKKLTGALKEIGLSATDVQAGMARDATGTLLKVVDAIGRLPQDQRIGVMVELVGLQHSDTLAKLVDKPEELRRQLGLALGGEAQGSMAREAQARYATLSAQWQVAKNNAFNLAAVVGESLKPALVDTGKAVGPWIQRAAEWAQRNPALVAGVMKLVLAGSALLVLLGATLVPLALVAAKMALLHFVLGKAALGMGLLGKLLPVLKLLGSGLMFVGRAAIGFLLTPMGAALALLAGAAYLVWRNWDGIKGGLAVIWQQISGGALALWQHVVAMKNRFVSAGADLMRGLAGGITSGLAWVKDAVVHAAAGAARWFKDKLGIQSPSRVFMALGQHIPEGAAIGIERGSPALRAAALAMAGIPTLAGAGPLGGPVGPLGGGLAATGAGGGGAAPITITIHAAPGQDPQAIARAVAAELDRRQRRNGERVRSQLSDIDG